jgi:adenine-specific DNA methylase
MPLTLISAQSAREKSIRHGHISTLHIWWARRPLAACRAAVFAALVRQPDDPKEAEKFQKFIAELSNWDNSIDSDSASGRTGAHHYIREAREYIRKALPNRSPRVLDPFAGGGSIPLEALRLGCETYALDLNPVAYIIQLATLVYPQKYARRPGSYGDKLGATLAGDVRKWGQWVLEKARCEVGYLYPDGSDGEKTAAFLWARTVPCPNPGCGVPVPLIRQTWLVRKAGKYVAYKIESDGPGSIPRFRIVDGKTLKDFDFDPAVGTSRGGTAVCPSCGTPLSETYIKARSRGGDLGALPVAIVTSGTDRSGKRYREVPANDGETYRHAERAYTQLISNYDALSGELPPVPDEPLVTNDTMNVKTPLYGLNTFGTLFNARQAVTLSTFAARVRDAAAVISDETGDPEYAKAIATYLAIAVDRLADRCSVLCRWHNTRETVENVFGRQAIPMVWDYAEVNPFSGLMGDWDGAIDWIRRVIEHAAATSDRPADVLRGSATQLPYDDGFFDAVITDPPYYNNIAYAELSDFFYVWLKRTVGDIYPTVLGAPVTPKDQEIIEGGSLKRSKVWFETELGTAFSECRRVLSDDGVCVVVYAHKAVSAWESLVASLLRAGLTVDASWPFSTEMGARLLGQGSAALASSIFLVCRKRRTDAGVGYASEVRRDIEANVRERLDDFWKAGLRGADFFISAIGPATAAFSRYDKVMTMGGEDVNVSTLLQWVQETVADYALRRLFTTAAHEQGTGTPEGGLGAVDSQTRFYVLWRWTYDGQGSLVGAAANGAATANGAGMADVTPSDAAEVEESSGTSTTDSRKIPFGDAHLMATALGSDINSLIHRYRLLQGSNTVKLLGASERTEILDLGESRADGSRPPLIDVLHRAELLWASGQQDELEEYLDGVLSPADREAFRRVAQALVDLLPPGDLEKQRLEGLLYSGVAGDSGVSGVTRPEPIRQASLGEEFDQPDVTVTRFARRKERRR